MWYKRGKFLNSQGRGCIRCNYCRKYNPVEARCYVKQNDQVNCAEVEENDAVMSDIDASSI